VHELFGFFLKSQSKPSLWVFSYIFFNFLKGQKDIEEDHLYVHYKSLILQVRMDGCIHEN